MADVSPPCDACADFRADGDITCPADYHRHMARARQLARRGGILLGRDSDAVDTVTPPGHWPAESVCLYFRCRACGRAYGFTVDVDAGRAGVREQDLASWLRWHGARDERTNEA